MILLDDIEEKIYYGYARASYTYDEMDKIRKINRSVRVMRLVFMIDQDLILGKTRCLKDYLSECCNPMKKLS